ncbi:hypothetical protein [Parvicella tangerina]|uniref:Uncharacterized protein n=1 Tax=Parvicella tangerina TaxID=2829795 RepID=A0A916JLS0_9FLAO|nr:hypothetical protein [Parvicella tangerina]CAG5081504.1 hypothetical protein CRYO30217_01649 [Parvicella tangerina]
MGDSKTETNEIESSEVKNKEFDFNVTFSRSYNIDTIANNSIYVIDTTHTLNIQLFEDSLNEYLQTIYAYKPGPVGDSMWGSNDSYFIANYETLNIKEYSSKENNAEIIATYKIIPNFYLIGTMLYDDNGKYMNQFLMERYIRAFKIK